MKVGYDVLSTKYKEKRNVGEGLPSLTGLLVPRYSGQAYGSQISFLGSRFLILGAWLLFPRYSGQALFLGSWLLVLGSCFLALGSRFLFLISCFYHQHLGSHCSNLTSYVSRLMSKKNETSHKHTPNLSPLWLQC
jgi:hypothetical protein